MNKIAILFIILLSSTTFAEMSKGSKFIVTSITPLASIIAMLVTDQVEIVSIANDNSCPHHYHLKPSDLTKVQDANMVFYIDEQFDGFAGKLMKSHNKNVIKISNFTGLKIINDNWHIWLILDNVIIILEQLSVILAEQFPDISVSIYQNLEWSKQQIQELAKIKETKLLSLTDAILLSDSLEYFFNAGQYNITKLYNYNQKSLKYINNLEKLLSKSSSKCLILSLDQDTQIYKKFNATIVAVDSENWQIDQITSNSFYSKYLKIINQVTQCLNY